MTSDDSVDSDDAGREPLLESVEPSVVERLRAASWALPVVDRLRDLADDVAGWAADGMSDREIDGRILARLPALGMGYEEWLADPETEAVAKLLPGVDLRKLWKAYGFDAWAVQCVRNIAFRDEPIPFLGWTMGTWYVVPDEDLPMLVAILTPMSDLKLALRQIENAYVKAFGKIAARPNRADEVEMAKFLYLKRQGMSLRDMAIQSLRSRLPGVVSNQRRYKQELDREKSRIAKRIEAGEKLWNERGA